MYNSLVFLLSISSFYSLALTNDISVTPSKIIFTDISTEDLDLGYKIANFSHTVPLSINVNTINSWKLFIQASDFQLSSNNGYNLPVHDIQWKISANNDNSYKPLLIDKQFIGSSNSNNSFIELNFRIKLNWFSKPGTYSIPFNIILEKSRDFSKKRRRVKK